MVQKNFNCVWQGAELAHHIEIKKKKKTIEECLDLKYKCHLLIIFVLKSNMETVLQLNAFVFVAGGAQNEGSGCSK